MSGSGMGIDVKSEVVCTGPDGKVKWRDGTSTRMTLEELGVRSIAEAELIFQSQVIHVGEGPVQ